MVRQAIVLAAGLGTRLRDLSQDIPKPLYPVAAHPMIEYPLNLLREVGVRQLVINIHHQPEKMRSYIRSIKDLNIIISDESDLLLDTGGGVAHAMGFLEGEEPFFVLNCDAIWLDVNPLQKLMLVWKQLQRQQADDPKGLVALVKRQFAFAYSGQGDFDIDDAGLIYRSSAPAYVFGGAQILTPTMFSKSPKTPFPLNTIWKRAIMLRALYGIDIGSRWVDTGYPQGVEVAERYLSKKE